MAYVVDMVNDITDPSMLAMRQHSATALPLQFLFPGHGEWSGGEKCPWRHPQPVPSPAQGI